MGYKRAGFNVLGNCEIDPQMNKIYIRNHHPKYNYLMDLRDFNKLNNLPEELYNLDILDGSPPCSTFSTCGDREKSWGKEKVFREGQKKQILDDLFFVFLDTVEKLKPKIVIAEHVTGIIKGNAKGYVNKIIKRFKELGYDVQMFKLNAAFMNVPQNRERIFFIANDQKYPKLKLEFNEKPIIFGEVRSEKGIPIGKESKTYDLLKHLKNSDTKLSDLSERIYGKYSSFTRPIYQDNRVAQTLIAQGGIIRACDKSWISRDDCKNVSTFPQDYDFLNQSVQYICGMSVPPNMMANIATEVYNQWLNSTQ